MSTTRLDTDTLTTALTDLNALGQGGWSLSGGQLCKTFVFTDFVRAFGFMTQVALIAESMNHHPDWSNVYGQVRVALSTHESGGITERDIALARQMERLVAIAEMHVTQ
ncbi:4a-hydroxytetrahydrobiopterin dehydratase [Allochromatium vinosum]|uniref:Putative pterin-4-alpha-carbinolamine dehydratase n=1 Tax=Allochromatium vinosum (strain ATCC 17899 / DSM 180 / NBRC 103801 / NCIMB 10441 / D) TaxID=572477 RepID=D3RU07_ALLVD|nr:4a-hydroxytetrahydrobiopterin dehydratase [Allochromatium vinosum]ADC62666.1 transcriptional coactivator/pterin dehydratase [Allochromatium vinosum DSM 180]